jgi:plastocyanin
MAAASEVVVHIQFVDPPKNAGDTGKPSRKKQTPAPHTAIPSATRTILWLTPNSPETRQQAQAQSPTPRSYTMVQQGKMFSPHMLVIPVGSVVSFPNKDPYFHNVFSLFNGRRFDLGLYQSGQTRSVAFNRLGVSYIFCNIHPEMSAVILTLDTPYYASPDEHGGIHLSGVPEGSYTLHIWSEATSPEALQLLTRTVTVSAGENPDHLTTLGEIQIQTAPSMLSEHLNKFGEAYDKHDTQTPSY